MRNMIVLYFLFLYKKYKILYLAQYTFYICTIESLDIYIPKSCTKHHHPVSVYRLIFKNSFPEGIELIQAQMLLPSSNSISHA